VVSATREAILHSHAADPSPPPAPSSEEAGSASEVAAPFSEVPSPSEVAAPSSDPSQVAESSSALVVYCDDPPAGCFFYNVVF
jgi:hypothetical protein